MKIGIDFDNTIVNYDAIFYKVAEEKGLITKKIPENKYSVKQLIINNGKEKLWTEIQGYVYGKRMIEAKPYPYFLEFLSEAKKNKIEVKIVSHKTTFPFIGPKYNLRKSALEWINNYLKEFDLKNVYFEDTKIDKISRISKLNFNYFIDDLPEILNSVDFPLKTKKVLFNPDNLVNNQNYYILKSWENAFDILK